MGGLAAYEDRGFSHRAPGFEHAMHGACMTCHRLEEKDAALAEYAARVDALEIQKAELEKRLAELEKLVREISKRR